MVDIINKIVITKPEQYMEMERSICGCIVMEGARGVGKTTLINHLITRRHENVSSKTFKRNLRGEFQGQHVTIDGIITKLQFWDKHVMQYLFIYL
jgi:GTPase SAR1 family protein